MSCEPEVALHIADLPLKQGRPKQNFNMQGDYGWDAIKGYSPGRRELLQTEVASARLVKPPNLHAESIMPRREGLQEVRFSRSSY
jgi:hypothetical protein